MNINVKIKFKFTKKIYKKLTAINCNFTSFNSRILVYFVTTMTGMGKLVKKRGG